MAYEQMVLAYLSHEDCTAYAAESFVSDFLFYHDVPRMPDWLPRKTIDVLVDRMRKADTEWDAQRWLRDVVGRIRLPLDVIEDIETWSVWSDADLELIAKRKSELDVIDLLGE